MIFEILNESVGLHISNTLDLKFEADIFQDKFKIYCTFHR